MEVLIFIILLVIVILLISLKGEVSRNTSALSQKIEQLRKEIKLAKPETETTASSPETAVVTLLIVDIPAPIFAPVDMVESKSEKIELETIREEVKASFNSAQAQSVPDGKIKRSQTKKSWQESIHNFFKNNPDLEKFIGENLINKIGIAILVLGIGFFVKYAIDQDWIHEIGRVFIGLLCGGILVGIAHKLRQNFKAFSSVLVGGGIAVFYFTITIAFREYHIFNQTAAFGLMVVITAFAVLLSLAYDRIELAILSIIGGFASPFLLSTGEGNYIVLFTYLLILNSGMLVLAYFKKWKLVNTICYAFTVIIFGAWLVKSVIKVSEGPHLGALIFATSFYLIFFFMNIVNNIREKKAFEASEIMILVSNTFIYFSEGLLILKNVDGGIYRGLFTAIIAIFNFIFAYSLYKSKKADSNLIYLLIGMVLTFLSLSAPIQLHGNYITLFWSAESVLLLWLSQKSGIKLIKLGSIIVIGLMLVSLIMDWRNIYISEEALPIIINKGFVTSMVSLICVYIT
ncbi:MAG TPA: DUF2339 domain-containing protein, partial [Cytophagaceae bacterium]